MTPATAKAAAECSEGKEVPPEVKNAPEPSPSKGLLRRNEYFSISTAMRLLNMASPDRNPVSVQCSSWRTLPRNHMPPAEPIKTPTPAFEKDLDLPIVDGS